MASNLRKALSDWREPAMMAVSDAFGDNRGAYGYGRPAHGSDPAAAYGFGEPEPAPAPFTLSEYIQSRRALARQAG